MQSRFQLVTISEHGQSHCKAFFLLKSLKTICSFNTNTNHLPQALGHVLLMLQYHLHLKSLYCWGMDKNTFPRLPKRLHNPLLKESHPLYSPMISPSSLQELQTPEKLGPLFSSDVIKSFSVHSLTMDTDLKQLKQI